MPRSQLNQFLLCSFLLSHLGRFSASEGFDHSSKSEQQRLNTQRREQSIPSFVRQLPSPSPKSRNLFYNPNSSSAAALCRVQNKLLPTELFQLETCALCYYYLPDQPAFFLPGSRWNLTVKPVATVHGVFNVTFLSKNGHVEAANATEPRSKVLQSLRTDKAVEKWSLCCKEAANCCQRMLTTEAVISETPICQRTWDGWQCWADTGPRQTAYAPCPAYIYFGTDPPSCTRYAFKDCSASGMYGRTNYSTCSPVGQLLQRNIVHLAAYGVSIVVIIPALLIFFAYKQLNVYRIRLHRNLLISMLANAIMVIAFKGSIIMAELSATTTKNSYIKQNGVGCRILFMLTKYFRVTNYSWMFCEGYYLHRLITEAFSEQKSFTIFYLLGWGLPIVPAVIYAVLRGLFYDENCWVFPIEAYEWVLNAPCLVSLIVNTIFLVNIIRILVSKLRNAPSNEPSQYRKAVKAALILKPLFGLHFIATIYRPPNKGCEWVEVYYYVNNLLDGLQGFLVAITFCYANSEVHYFIKRSYERFKARRWSQSPLLQSSATSVNLFRSRISRNSSVQNTPNPKRLMIPLTLVSAAGTPPNRASITEQHNAQDLQMIETNT